MPGKIKETKEILKQKVGVKKESLRRFVDMLIDEKGTGKKVLDKPANSVKVLIAAFKKFLIDDCTSKASTIAYTVIVSLIPTLTVALSFYSVFSGASGKKDELFRKVSLFMLEHNIKLNIDPIFSAISGLLDNSAKIGGIGAAVMIFSATALLRSLEKSLNEIYRVKKHRSIYLKVIYYWAVLTLGPIMLIAGTAIATQISTAFSSPNINSLTVSGKTLWAVGDKSNILKTEIDGFRFTAISIDSIDYDNQKVYQSQNRELVEVDEKIEPLDVKSTKFNDIQFEGENGWIVSGDGLLLSTEDNGKKWNLTKLGNYPLNDIHMLDKNRGFIAAGSGTILKTASGGRVWTIVEWPGITSSLKNISFRGDTGIISGSRGTILISRNGGADWQRHEIQSAKKQFRDININGHFMADEKNIWLFGDEGIILKSIDGGVTWDMAKFREFNYQCGYFISAMEGFIGADKGTVIYTEDGGEKWIRSKLPTYKINSMQYQGGRIIASGDTGLIMTSANKGETWLGEKGSNIVAGLINFLAPFGFIWLLFLLIYMSLPNIKVPFKPAAIGAAFTGAVWVGFLLFFILYIKAFAKGTFAVYGTLAAIPLFLLGIYASATIILYGAEVAYTLMHPEFYKKIGSKGSSYGQAVIFYGLSIVHYIYKKFESGQGASGLKEIHKAVNDRTDEAEYFLGLLTDNGIIMTRDENEYLPSNSSANVKIKAILDIIQNIGKDIPDSAKEEGLKKFAAKIFLDLEESRIKTLGDMTVKDLIS